ncbi:DMT family transporter [Cochlodiniinecator piscidefendens]|uniref:DMT family transporter n=1 Tax=Cochlodiniinecator piscidefendens TaxID=2715756 RepID=UPI00140BAA61|nr:DMT family transporter [Cochlodiniinecator piscidefendens]
MQTWIYITIAAAFSQNLRFMLQKQLKATRLSTGGATFARFVYSAPLVVLLITLYFWAQGYTLPHIPHHFWIYAFSGGIAQILATMCVVALFAERNFAVGITFKKTEVVQTAFLGLIVLGEGISFLGFIAISIGFLGVILLSDPPVKTDAPWAQRIFNRSAGLGLLSGVLFAVSAIGYRGASLSLEITDFVARAGVTLAFVVTFQTLVMCIWLRLREAGEITRVFKHWRVGALVGLTSMIGSFGWFAAFTLQNAAYVKALGQTELLFSFITGIVVFREKTSPRELAAMGLVSISIIVLILAI